MHSLWLLLFPRWPLQERPRWRRACTGGVYVQRVVTLQTAEMVLSAYEKLESSELNTTELSSNLVRMSSPVAASLSLFSFVWVY